MDSLSQVEVLVHELAHLVDRVPFGSIEDFEDPGCTEPTYPDNVCYEYPNALYLAARCPSCAQSNAENYAGFAAEAFMRPAWFSAL